MNTYVSKGCSTGFCVWTNVIHAMLLSDNIGGKGVLIVAAMQLKNASSRPKATSTLGMFKWYKQVNITNLGGIILASSNATNHLGLKCQHKTHHVFFFCNYVTLQKTR